MCELKIILFLIQIIHSAGNCNYVGEVWFCDFVQSFILIYAESWSLQIGQQIIDVLFFKVKLPF